MVYFFIVTVLLAPTFAVRFNVGGLSTNILMIWVLLVWLLFAYNLIIKKQLGNFFRSCLQTDKKVLIAVTGFFIAGLLSLFVKGFDSKKFGQFIVLFLQPISLFFIGSFIFAKNSQAKTWLLYILYIFLGVAGVYAIIQYTTLRGLPSIYWGNSLEPKRAISFFGHPDFYALFTAPLLAFLLPDWLGEFSVRQLAGKSFQFLKLFKTVLWILGAAGLFLSLSRAGWLGLAAAVFVYAIFAGNKIIRSLIAAAAVVVIVIVAIVPNWRYRVITPFYGEKSATSRTQLWKDGLKGISESPIFGLGLNGFSNNWERFNTDPNQNSANFPHNVFLDFWVDTGILGLISFVYLCGIYILRGFRSLRAIQSNDGKLMTSPTAQVIPFAITLFLITLFIQGQFDNPYFRNDLALIFWIILSLSF